MHISINMGDVCGGFCSYERMIELEDNGLRKIKWLL